MLKKPEKPVSFIKSNVVILGAGIAGCLSALKLADNGMQVCLIDKQDEVMSGASVVNPGRMGLGFHYEHLATALAYLEATIEFAKTFPANKYTIGRHNPGGYLQRGRYFITKDSLFPKEKILATYEKIKQRYQQLVNEDPTNKIFGEPEDFYRILDKREYEHDVNLDIVDVGVETAECLLEVGLFRKHLIEKLKNNKNIRIFTNHAATKFTCDPEDDLYVVNCITKNTSNLRVTFKGDFIVNATWEFVEQVTQSAGLVHGLPKDGRTNRLKVLAEVQLPESLKNKNSMFFCMGPHCMFSNMGDGRGLMSYAPNTNVDSSTHVYVPPKIQLFTKQELSDMEEDERKQILGREKFGEKIIKGVAKYIPDMAKAKLIGLRFGIVKTTGEVDIFDPSSPFHIRNYSGVEAITLGWINNASMKLLYGLNNAEIVYKLIADGVKIAETLPNVVSEKFNDNSVVVDKHKQRVIVKNMKRYFFYNDFADPKILEQTISTAIMKEKLTTTIKDHHSPTTPIPTNEESITKAWPTLVNVASLNDISSLFNTAAEEPVERIYTPKPPKDERDTSPLRRYHMLARSASGNHLDRTVSAPNLTAIVTKASTVVATTTDALEIKAPSIRS